MNGTTLKSGSWIAGGAIIRVGTSAATGTPLAPLATIYSDAALTTPIDQNTSPVTADANGNYTWYAPGGVYREELTYAGGTLTRTVVVPFDPASPPAIGQTTPAAGTFTDVLLATLNKVILADRCAGATADVKLNAARALAIAAGGAIIDARGFGATTQTIAATVALSDGTNRLHWKFSPATTFVPTAGLGAGDMFTIGVLGSVDGINGDSTSVTAFTGNGIASRTGLREGWPIIENVRFTFPQDTAGDPHPNNGVYIYSDDPSNPPNGNWAQQFRISNIVVNGGRSIVTMETAAATGGWINSWKILGYDGFGSTYGIRLSSGKDAVGSQISAGIAIGHYEAYLGVLYPGQTNYGVNTLAAIQFDGPGEIQDNIFLARHDDVGLVYGDGASDGRGISIGATTKAHNNLFIGGLCSGSLTNNQGHPMIDDQSSYAEGNRVQDTKFGWIASGGTANVQWGYKSLVDNKELARWTVNGVDVLAISDYTPNLYLASTNRVFFIGTSDNQSLKFLTNNTERMALDGSGGVWGEQWGITQPGLGIFNAGVQLASGGTVIKQAKVFTGIAVDPGSIAATSKGSKAVTIAGTPGIAAGDLIVPITGAQLIADDLLFQGCRATGANEVTWDFYNPTASPIDDASQNWSFMWLDVT